MNELLGWVLVSAAVPPPSIEELEKAQRELGVAHRAKHPMKRTTIGKELASEAVEVLQQEAQLKGGHMDIENAIAVLQQNEVTEEIVHLCSFIANEYDKIRVASKLYDVERTSGEKADELYDLADRFEELLGITL